MPVTETYCDAYWCNFQTSLDKSFFAAVSTSTVLILCQIKPQKHLRASNFRRIVWGSMPEQSSSCTLYLHNLTTSSLIHFLLYLHTGGLHVWGYSGNAIPGHGDSGVPPDVPTSSTVRHFFVSCNPPPSLMAYTHTHIHTHTHTHTHRRHAHSF